MNPASSSAVDLQGEARTGSQSNFKAKQKQLVHKITRELGDGSTQFNTQIRIAKGTVASQKVDGVMVVRRHGGMASSPDLKILNPAATVLPDSPMQLNVHASGSDLHLVKIKSQKNDLVDAYRTNVAEAAVGVSQELHGMDANSANDDAEGAALEGLVESQRRRVLQKFEYLERLTRGGKVVSNQLPGVRHHEIQIENQQLSTLQRGTITSDAKDRHANYRQKRKLGKEPIVSPSLSHEGLDFRTQYKPTANASTLNEPLQSRLPAQTRPASKPAELAPNHDLRRGSKRSERATKRYSSVTHKKGKFRGPLFGRKLAKSVYKEHAALRASATQPAKEKKK